VLFLEAVDGRVPMSERDLRTIVRHSQWEKQRARWDRITRGSR
jgi:hypothetical protein